jgi:hypothetical protein
MLKKRKIDEVVQRNKAFINREPTERPLFGIWIGSYMPFQMYRKAMEKLSLNEGTLLTPDVLDPQGFLEDIDRLFWKHEQVGDDLLWAATPVIGFSWMEAIVGCPIRASSDSFWNQPYIDKWGKIDEINFSPENKWFQKMLEFKEVFAEHSKGRYPVATSPSPIRGIGDMMGAALGQERLCLELYDNLEKVKKLASIYTYIWIQVNKIQIEKTPKFSNGYVVAFYNIWTPDLCQYDQEDALDYFSPRFFKEVLLKSHTKICNNFPYPLIHLHPNSLYCLEDLYKINSLKIIEINKDLCGPSISKMLPTLKEVQKHKPLVIWGDLTGEEIGELLNNLSPSGLCIYPVVKTVEEGKILIRKMKERNL